MNKSTPVLLCALTGSLIFSIFQWRELQRLRERTDGGPHAAATPGNGPLLVPKAEPPPGNSKGNQSPAPPGGHAPSAEGAGVKRPLRAIVQPDGGFIIAGADGAPLLVSTVSEMAEVNKQAGAVLTAERIKRPGGPAWSPGQAAGPPDTAEAVDAHTAWASATQDGGHEWLNLKYANAVELSEVTVYESYNAGALTRILAILPDGSEKVLWSGTAADEEGIVERVVSVPPGIRSNQIRVELDTSRVPGWNEIDAVELVGTDGSRQWAAEATASSYYGEDRNPGP